MASPTFGCSPGWEDCSVRLFENQSTGKYRILTLQGGNADQRNGLTKHHSLPFPHTHRSTVSLSATELVPEYCYHESLPVIYLRSAGEGAHTTHNPQRDKKHYRKTSISSNSGPLSAASLYYKFLNIYGTSLTTSWPSFAMLKNSQICSTFSTPLWAKRSRLTSKTFGPYAIPVDFCLASTQPTEHGSSCGNRLPPNSAAARPLIAAHSCWEVEYQPCAPPHQQK